MNQFLAEQSKAEQVMARAEFVILGHVIETGDISILGSFRDIHREHMSFGQVAFDLANGVTTPDEIGIDRPDIIETARIELAKAKKPEIWPTLWHRHFASHHAPILSQGYSELLRTGKAKLSDIVQKMQALEPLKVAEFVSVLDWARTPGFTESGGRRPTGISSLDVIMDGGVPDDDATLILGLTSFGKSALAETILTNWARMYQWRSLYLVIEMTEQGTAKRFMAQDVQNLRIRDFRGMGQEVLNGVIAEAGAQDLISLLRPETDWPSIRSIIHTYFELFPDAAGVAVDYYQQIGNSELARNTQESQLKAVAEEFGTICRTYKKSGLLLAQMNGSMEKDRKPSENGMPAMPSEYSTQYCRAACNAVGAMIALGNQKPQGYPAFDDASKRYVYNLKNRGGAGAGRCAPMAFFPHKTLFVGHHDRRYPFEPEVIA